MLESFEQGRNKAHKVPMKRNALKKEDYFMIMYEANMGGMVAHILKQNKLGYQVN